MANERHLRLVAQGDYTDSALSAEIWQVGINLAAVVGTVDDVSTFPTNLDVVNASISDTDTHWTVNGNWKITSGDQTLNPNDYLNDYAAPSFAAWLNDADIISSKTRLRSLKLSVVGPDGKEVPPPGIVGGTPCTLTWTDAYPVGLNGGGIMPLENAVVASHRTNQFGRKGRGRMFIPGFSPSALNSSGELSSGSCGGILTRQIALLEGLSYSGIGPGTFHIRPVITGSPWTHYAVINSVKVGNYFDTQRRRRNAIVETYYSGTTSYG